MPQMQATTKRQNLLFGTCLLLSLMLLVKGLALPVGNAPHLLAALAAVLMAALGLTLLLLRRNQAPACLLGLYLTLLAIATQDSTLQIVPPKVFSIGGLEPLAAVWILLLGAAALLFAWYYVESEPDAPPVNRRAVLGLLAFGAFFQTGSIYAASLGERGLPALALHASHLSSPFRRLLLYSAPAVLLEQAAAFALLSQLYGRHRNGRNLSVLLLYSATLFLTASIIVSDIVPRFETYFLANAAAYFVSILFVHALENYALFDVRIVIRRVVQYTLARQVIGIMTFGPLVALAFFLGLGVDPAPKPSPLITQGPMYCGILLFIFTIMMGLRNPLLAWFDRTYFREIYDAQHVLNQVGRSLLGVTDPHEIAETALAGIASVLHPVRAALIGNENGVMERFAALQRKGKPAVTFPLIKTFLDCDEIQDVSLLLKRRPARAVWLQSQPETVLNALRESAVYLLIPLREEGRTVGVILLGQKGSGLPYAPEDIEMLRALASQTALALNLARLNRELVRQGTQELTLRSVGFVELVEQERHLLAADLHDQTLPELRCLLTDLETLAAHQGELETSLAVREPVPADAMAEQVRQAIASIRDIMESLRPSALEMLGLHAALESEVRKSAVRARPPLTPQFQILDDALPDEMTNFAEVSVFRIMQEAVNNACRHAKATRLRVQIGVDGGEWFLRVEDDGTGLPPQESRRKGWGLDNMMYRASLIDAKIVWSVPDWERGTRVELRLPLGK